MRLLWLADVLRAAGLDVHEVDGWQQRGTPFPQPPSVVIGHHTATLRTTANEHQDMRTLNTLLKGRVGTKKLAGPLCQLGLGRTGTYYVIAAGKANHAGPGAWAGVDLSVHTLGIEAENDGVGEAWPQQQLDAYDRGIAAVLAQLGQGAERYAGHREWALPAGRKQDPAGIDLDAQRARVAALLRSGAAPRVAAIDLTTAPPDVKEPEMDREALTSLVREVVRAEILTVLGTPLPVDQDPTHYALNDVRHDLAVIKAKLELA